MSAEGGPTRAMVLAAGLGLRMRPLTLDRPKPLLTVAGRSLLDHALDRLEAAGVGLAVVNAHYLGDQIAAHLASRPRPRCVLSPEDELLETGGGVRRALPHFGSEPFYAVNADILWRDGPALPALARLAAVWDAARMDALLLLTPADGAMGYHGAGDYHLTAGGADVARAATRRGSDPAAAWVFAGVMIAHPRLYCETPDGAFSNTLVWDRAQREGRLCGLAHDGHWFHVGTPEALADTNRWFAESSASTAPGLP